MENKSVIMRQQVKTSFNQEFENQEWEGISNVEKEDKNGKKWSLIMLNGSISGVIVCSAEHLPNSAFKGTEAAVIKARKEGGNLEIVESFTGQISKKNHYN